MAIKKEITSDVGIRSDYHRISRIDFDYDKNQIHIWLKSYADETYRDHEKTEFSAIEADIARYYELQALEDRTEAESTELATLNIQELEAGKITETHLQTAHFTIDLSDDVRGAIYTRMMQEIPQFNDGSDA